MKQAYINCLKKLREFRKNLKLDKDIKRGKNYKNNLILFFCIF